MNLHSALLKLITKSFEISQNVTLHDSDAKINYLRPKEKEKATICFDDCLYFSFFFAFDLRIQALNDNA